MLQETKPLYCIAHETFTGNGWEAGLTYTHGDNAANARRNFMAGLGAKVAYRTRIVAIGPVIGYYAKETAEKTLVYSV